MDSFDIRNTLKCSFSFTASDGLGATPTAAVCTVEYPRPDGTRKKEKITLVYDNASGRWVGYWDSSSAVEGQVDWLAECSGPLKGSLKGSFILESNGAYPASYLPVA